MKVVPSPQQLVLRATLRILIGNVPISPESKHHSVYSYLGGTSVDWLLSKHALDGSDSDSGHRGSVQPLWLVAADKCLCVSSCNHILRLSVPVALSLLHGNDFYRLILCGERNLFLPDMTLLWNNFSGWHNVLEGKNIYISTLFPPCIMLYTCYHVFLVVFFLAKTSKMLSRCLTGSVAFFLPFPNSAVSFMRWGGENWGQNSKDSSIIDVM